MSKQDYLAALRRALAQMPPEELERQLAYYDELLSDMCEDGMTETEATARLGEPGAVAAELLASLPLGTLVKSRVKPSGGWSALSIVLLILGAPLWLPLLIALAAVLFSVLIVLWALYLSLAAVVLSLLVSAAAVLVGSLFGAVEGTPLMLAGVILLTAGAGILLALALPPLAHALVRLSRAFIRGVKSLFIKKEA